MSRDSQNGDIELQTTSASDAKDSATNSAHETGSAPNDRPPNPPRRDYAAEPTQVNNSEQDRINKRKLLGSSFPPRIEYISKRENTEGCMSCLQKSLVVVNLFIWLLGAVITAVGIWVKVDAEFWTIQTTLDISQFSAAGWVLIAVGVLVMLVGFCGCYGAIASKIWMLVIFSIIVIILILMEIAVIALVWSVAANDSMKEDIKLKARKAIQEMDENEAKLYFIDLVQTKLKCCGVSGPEDYSANLVKPKKIPNSCTDPDKGTHTKGCYDAILEFLKSKAAVVGGIALAVLLLQLGVLVLTICLLCGMKNSATNMIF